MDLGLKGKTALVTGGSSGIGLAIAQKLAEEGCKVAICGRDRGKLDAAVKQVLGAKAFSADMREPAQVAKLVEEVVAALGGIDIVVSNAGTHLPGRFNEIAPEKLAGHFAAKVTGAYELARRIAPHMQKRGGGRFIVIIGQAGKVPQANGIASNIVNAAQHAFVKALSDELAPSKILVNAVCPSRIKSPLTEGLTLYNEVYLGRSLEQQESKWGAEVPMGHWGAAEDIANAVLFLASERAQYIVGANIDVDGGHQRMIFKAAPMIDLRHVSKTFRKSAETVEAVRDINVSIAPKEIVAVIGPSGCGKSTLLNMIAGLYAPSAGTVFYKGAAVSDVNTDVGYMTQKDNLLPWRDVRDNIAFPLELAGVPKGERLSRAQAVMKQLGLDGFETRFPHELSGGMRKRACLARMLLYGAETALLDEPFAALDAQLKLAMHGLLLKLAAETGQTIVLVTHDLMEAVTLADRVLVCTRRPAVVALEQRIELQRPRDVLNVRFTPQFKEHYDSLWERLRLEYTEERV